MPENTIIEHVSFFKFLEDLASFAGHLGHDIVTSRINFFSDRVECCHPLGFEILIESCEDRTNPVNKGISFCCFLEFYSSFQVVYLRKEWEEEFAREKKSHI